jgi:hypothetical protein
MLLLDTMLYIFLAWYLDQVVPREYGTARPVWFLFSPHYWCGVMDRRDGSDKSASSWSRAFSPRGDDGDAVHTTDDGSAVVASTNDNSSDNGEEFAANQHEKMTDLSLWPRIKICKLTKQYKKRNIFTKKRGDGDMPPPAVDQLDLDLYESQITTLLGHNGTSRRTLPLLFPPFLLLLCCHPAFEWPLTSCLSSPFTRSWKDNCDFYFDGSFFAHVR